MPQIMQSMVLNHYAMGTFYIRQVHSIASVGCISERLVKPNPKTFLTKEKSFF